MKKIILTLLFVLASTFTFAQSIASVKSEQMFSTNLVSFELTEEYSGTQVVFYDTEKLVDALTTCKEVLTEVGSISRKARKALIEGIDTLFPRAIISWHVEDTMVVSFNNVLKPSIQVIDGKTTLNLSGKAICRLKFGSPDMISEVYDGDLNTHLDYTISFESPEDIDNLLVKINTRAPKRRFIRPTPPFLAFPVVYDQDFHTHSYGSFIKRFK